MGNIWQERQVCGHMVGQDVIVLRPEMKLEICVGACQEQSQ